MSKQTMKFKLDSLKSRGKTVGYHLDVLRDVSEEMVNRLPTETQDEARNKLCESFIERLSNIPHIKYGDTIEAEHINALREGMVTLFHMLSWKP